MRILVVGSGGREHALTWKLAQSPMVEKVYVAPGNAGTGLDGINIDIAVDDIPGLVRFCQQNKIDLVVPGPELPLTLGLADELKKVGIACFGPSAYCARLEGSKSFAKELMQETGVPTAASSTFDNLEDARKHVLAHPGPCVVKADGLAAGKGVVVAANQAEALAALEEILGGARFGSAGSRVIVEERLEGEEVSLLCLCNGAKFVPLPSAQDHKAAFDDDKGPNTGGMGAYSPAPLLPDDRLAAMADMVILPVLEKLAEQGQPFLGVLYAGLMLTRDGPKVLEYNVRFGDPECEPLMMRLKSDLAQVLSAAVQGRLKPEDLEFSSDAALGVVLAAEGYPGDYVRDLPISGIDGSENKVVVFHAGTKKHGDQVLSSGGRVLCVTALGKDLEAARDRAYSRLKNIVMPQSRYRNDIGRKGLNHLHK